MNRIDKRPNYKRIYNAACARFNSTHHFYHGPYDETFYTLRVYETAKEIIRRLDRKCETQKIIAAALLHDVGKSRLKTDRKSVV